VSYRPDMALASPSLRSVADATRQVEHTQGATVLPLKHRANAPAVPGREGTRRELVRMELLVERARDERSARR
jgi:hypothetical protein